MVKIQLIYLMLATLTVARADDWPQWMGPQRDNVWRESGIIQRFPDGGPKVLWRSPVGTAEANSCVFANVHLSREYTVI